MDKTVKSDDDTKKEVKVYCDRRAQYSLTLPISNSCEQCGGEFLPCDVTYDDDSKVFVYKFLKNECKCENVKTEETKERQIILSVGDIIDFSPPEGMELTKINLVRVE